MCFAFNTEYLFNVHYTVHLVTIAILVISMTHVCYKQILLQDV